MDNVSAPISIFIATWPSIGSTELDPPMMPPGKIHDLQFRGIRAVTRSGPPNAHPDGDSTMFFQGHPESAIENVLLEDINITFSGGGTLEQADRRGIVDMDKIDYRNYGYWTDHQTTSRHSRGLHRCRAITAPAIRAYVHPEFRAGSRLAAHQRHLSLPAVRSLD